MMSVLTCITNIKRQFGESSFGKHFSKIIFEVK